MRTGTSVSTVQIDRDQILKFMEQEGITYRRLGELTNNPNAVINGISTGRMNRSTWLLCQLIMEMPAVRKYLEKRFPALVFRKRVVGMGGVKYVARKKTQSKPKIAREISVIPDEAADEYNDGMSLRQLAEKYQASRGRMTDHLKAMGVVMRQPIKETPFRALIPEVKRRFAAGEKQSVIARELKILPTVVHRMVTGAYDRNPETVAVPEAGEKEKPHPKTESRGLCEGQRTLLPVRDEDPGPSGREMGGGARHPDRERRFQYLVKSEGGTRRLSQAEIEERKNGISQRPAYPGQVYRRP